MLGSLKNSCYDLFVMLWFSKSAIKMVRVLVKFCRKNWFDIALIMMELLRMVIINWFLKQNQVLEMVWKSWLWHKFLSFIYMKMHGRWIWCIERSKELGFWDSNLVSIVLWSVEVENSWHPFYYVGFPSWYHWRQNQHSLMVEIHNWSYH